MKKRLLNTGIIVLLGVIWLFPFQAEWRDWISVSGFAAAFICLELIPQKYVSFAACAVIASGMSVYDARFASSFAPALFAVSSVNAVGSGDVRIPLKKDGFLLTCLLFTSVFTVISAVYSVASLSRDPLSFTFERSTVWLSLAFAALVWFLITAVRLRGENAGARGKKTDFSSEKLTAVFSALIAVFAAVSLFILKQSADDKIFGLSPFIMSAAAFTAKNKVTAFVLREKE
ncbi:MAG: hypothetical protein IJS90_10330 [Clostridia bacterium]|nr:hypothetical protein [Clostridia bacterium]